MFNILVFSQIIQNTRKTTNIFNSLSYPLKLSSSNVKIIIGNEIRANSYNTDY